MATRNGCLGFERRFLRRVLAAKFRGALRDVDSKVTPNDIRSTRKKPGEFLFTSRNSGPLGSESRERKCDARSRRTRSERL
jgi:hypothetical protein